MLIFRVFNCFIRKPLCFSVRNTHALALRYPIILKQKRFTLPVCKKTPVRHLGTVENFRNSYSNLFKSVTESDTVGAVKDALVVVHDVTGLPWCGTIIFTTLFLRLFITFPLGAYQSYVLARLELVKAEFSGVVKELKRETAVAIKRFGWTEKEARIVYNASLKTQWRLLIERDNCHPLKTTLVVWIQLPLWIILSLAFRCMAYKYGQDPQLSELIAEQLSREGTAWVGNLLEPDPLYILPCTVSLTNLAIIELMVSSKPQTTRAQRILTNVFRGFALLSLPIALQVPSCMSIYWSVSSILALSQNVALMSPRLRRSLGIPDTPSQQPNPYRHAWTNFKAKLPFSNTTGKAESDVEAFQSKLTLFCRLEQMEALLLDRTGMLIPSIQLLAVMDF